MVVIKKVDMFKNHLRLVVGHVDNKLGDRCVLLDTTEAQRLVNDIYDKVDLHPQPTSTSFRTY
jgi:hypothetical protein